MLRFVCLALFITLATANPISFTNCGSLGQVTEVDVQGCTSLPCIFKKGETYNIDTKFTFANSGAGANLAVTASVSIITVDIIKPGNNNGCAGLSSGCPYTAGSSVSHRTTITISDQFIETDATVTLKVLNASNGAEVCIRAAARVVA